MFSIISANCFYIFENAYIANYHSSSFFEFHEYVHRSLGNLSYLNIVRHQQVSLNFPASNQKCFLVFHDGILACSRCNNTVVCARLIYAPKKPVQKLVRYQ